MEIQPRLITLSVAAAADEGSFSFTCPACSARVRQPATRKTLAVLMAAGAKLAHAGPDEGPVLPPEDRAPDPDAPPFTLDDLLDLHFVLRGDVGLADVLRR